MRVLDLFSGIGGFSLGLQRAGMQTVAFCEIDPFCRRVLEKRFPGVSVFEDIRTLTKRSLQEAGVTSDAEPIDLICGGFPCQPFSVAGKQRGKDDDRYLWPEMLRVIKEVKPRWIMAENVGGIASLWEPISPTKLESRTIQRLLESDYYKGVFTRQEMLFIANVIKDIEEAGYKLPEALDGTPIIPIVPACAVNAPHQRNRVWIVAHAGGDGLREPGVC